MESGFGRDFSSIRVSSDGTVTLNAGVAAGLNTVTVEGTSGSLVRDVAMGHV